jgi:hypothetical protein
MSNIANHRHPTPMSYFIEFGIVTSSSAGEARGLADGIICDQSSRYERFGTFFRRLLSTGINWKSVGAGVLMMRTYINSRSNTNRVTSLQVEKAVHIRQLHHQPPMAGNASGFIEPRRVPKFRRQ